MERGQNDSPKEKDNEQVIETRPKNEMEKGILADFEKMKNVYDYLKRKLSGENSLYPEGYSQKEKDSLRRYANKYELESKYMLNLLLHVKIITIFVV